MWVDDDDDDDDDDDQAHNDKIGPLTANMAVVPSGSLFTADWVGISVLTKQGS